MNPRHLYFGLDVWNIARFSTAMTGLALNGWAIWSHALLLIVLGFGLGGVSQFINLLRHSENGRFATTAPQDPRSTDLNTRQTL